MSGIKCTFFAPKMEANPTCQDCPTTHVELKGELGGVFFPTVSASGWMFDSRSFSPSALGPASHRVRRACCVCVCVCVCVCIACPCAHRPASHRVRRAPHLSASSVVNQAKSFHFAVCTHAPTKQPTKFPLLFLQQKLEESSEFSPRSPLSYHSGVVRRIALCQPRVYVQSSRYSFTRSWLHTGCVLRCVPVHSRRFLQNRAGSQRMFIRVSTSQVSQTELRPLRMSLFQAETVNLNC